MPPWSARRRAGRVACYLELRRMNLPRTPVNKGHKGLFGLGLEASGFRLVGSGQLEHPWRSDGHPRGYVALGVHQHRRGRA